MMYMGGKSQIAVIWERKLKSSLKKKTDSTEKFFVIGPSNA